MHCAEIRKKSDEKKYPSIAGYLKAKEENQDVVWHRSCYSDFTSEGHIKPILKKQHCVSELDDLLGDRQFKESTGIDVYFVRLTLNESL